MNSETAKIMGGLGAALLFIGVFSFRYMGFILLVGLILVTIAMYSFAGIYRERRIFNCFLFGILAGAGGIAIAIGVAIASVFATVVSLIYKLYPGWNGDWMALADLTPDISGITPGDVMPILGGMIVVAVIIYATVIASSFLVRRSLNAMAEKTSINLFSTAALVLVIGAFMTIVVVGVILIWIAALLVAIAFFKIRAQPEYIAPPVAQAPPESKVV